MRDTGQVVALLQQRHSPMLMEVFLNNLYIFLLYLLSTLNFVGNVS